MRNTILTSINDLLDSDAVIPILIITFFVLMFILIPYGLIQYEKNKDRIYEEKDTTSSIVKLTNVKIVARRTSPHPSLGNSVMVNYIVVECEDGKRFEFAIKSSDTFGTMIEGDVGDLTYQGKKFIDFRRR